MALVQESRNELIERVHSLIKQNSGKIRTLDLDLIIGDKQNVRTSISRLTVIGRITRRRGLGASGVEYFYHDVSSPSFEKHRKMESRAFGQPSFESSEYL
jgi:hypothetical protein